MRRVLVPALVATGLAVALHAFWIPVKAAVAQVLLERAWEEVRKDGRPHPPWPWADTTPVARLRAPRQGVDQIVLAGASGRTLAFGPGHLLGSAPLGSAGHAALAGHRDTHFAFLRELVPGDRLELEVGSARHHYRVEQHLVVHETEAGVLDADAVDRLSLVTCFPFDALSPGGPLRYVVSARRVSSSSETAHARDDPEDADELDGSDFRPL